METGSITLTLRSSNKSTSVEVWKPLHKTAPKKTVHADQKYITALLNNDAALLNEMYKKFSGKIKLMILQNNGTETTLDDLLHNEEEEQKRRAAERISKLRNLSFNMNAADANTEYDNVPAYVRRNMELFGNTLTSVEQFYSKYTVKKDENDETQISTINTFLDGKKPD